MITQCLTVLTTDILQQFSPKVNRCFVSPLLRTRLGTSGYNLCVMPAQLSPEIDTFTETEAVLQILRDTVRGTDYAGRLFLVGGFVRDQVMGLSSAKEDIDIVLEGDALALARFLRESGAADFEPVVYPRFGTAMVMVKGRDVELVTARIESYAPESRKPDSVEAGTLADDAKRRDFTINTLLQNLETGEIADPLGKAFADIDAQIIRTPTDPRLTFQDRPSADAAGRALRRPLRLCD